MERRPVVERRDGPVTLELDRLVADGDDQRRRPDFVDSLMKDRAADPDDVPVVVFDFRPFSGVVIEGVQVVRREVAVGDRVFVLVAGARLVDVHRRQRRSERHERSGYEQRSHAGHRTNHAGIIQAERAEVNRSAVTRRSETGQ